MGAIEADHILLGELAMQGELVEIPEVLYKMRRHAKCATEINRTARELLAWHDPSRANERIFLPHWERVYLEYFKAIRLSSISTPEKLLCYCAVPLVSYWRRFLRWSGPLRNRIKPGLTARNMEREPASSKASSPEPSSCSVQLERGAPTKEL